MRRIGAPLLFLVALTHALAQNPVRVKLVPWAEGLGPITDIAVNGDGRLYVAGQDGRVWIVQDSMQVLPQPFLDISAITFNAFEMGLLGLAFDPDYATNGRFYAHYVYNVGPTPSRISRFQVSSDPDSALVDSETIIYSIPGSGTPYHRGGDIEFGPDGMLHISLGDGFFPAFAPDLSKPYGKILRIDVSGDAWTIPPDNPYANAGADTLPEIRASGLRNPFRIGFDRMSGDLWIGDVGQSQREELDLIAANDSSAPDFGWPCHEGSLTYQAAACQPGANYTFPVFEHTHSPSGGNFCSIIVGRVYHGPQWPHFTGRFFYTDYCAADIYNLRPNGTGGWISELSLDTVLGGATCIVEDDEGELFLGHRTQGKVFRMVDRCPMDAPEIVQDGAMLTTTSAGSLQWYFSGVPIAGATGPEFTPMSAGPVYVVADHGGGCVLNSGVLNYVPTGVAATSGPAGFRVVPNRTSGTTTIGLAQPCTTCRIQVVDMHGRVVRDIAAGNDMTIMLDVTGLAEGAYAVLLIARDGVTGAQRLVVVRE